MLLSNQSNQICLTTRAPRLLQVGKTFKTFNTHKTNKRYMYTLLITRDVAFLFIYLLKQRQRAIKQICSFYGLQILMLHFASKSALD